MLCTPTGSFFQFSFTSGLFFVSLVVCVCCCCLLCVVFSSVIKNSCLIVLTLVTFDCSCKEAGNWTTADTGATVQI